MNTERQKVIDAYKDDPEHVVTFCSIKGCDNETHRWIEVPVSWQVESDTLQLCEEHYAKFCPTGEDEGMVTMYDPFTGTTFITESAVYACSETCTSWCNN